ncbi:MAG: ABC transporter permease [Candidatus Hydrogenedentes bacterium]|nr:ABC transporter permease [Candidatus Hydrogenedentota bacterium]
MIKRILFRRESALLLTLILLFSGFAYFTEGFLDAYNLLERCRYWTITGLVAVPMTFIIATAGIDLSVGSIVGLSGIVLGLLYRDAGWPLVFAGSAAVLTGLAAGAFNGGITSYIKVPPLVVTLATMALYSGMAVGLSKGEPIRNFPESFTWLSLGDAFEIPFGGSTVAFPVPLFALASVFAVGAVIFRRTWVGRFTECIGENETASQFAAIDVGRMKLLLYTVTGLICGVTSIFYTALYASARPDAGKGLELDAIACVVVGGTRVSGGQGSVLGTLLGLLIIGILKYGLEMASVPSEQLVIYIGALLILMTIFNEWVASNRGAKS